MFAQHQGTSRAVARGLTANHSRAVAHILVANHSRAVSILIIDPAAGAGQA